MKVHRGQGWTLLEGDCLEAMTKLRGELVDAVVCDPPYELGFMNKSWDSSGIAFRPETWALVLKMLKPGGHLLAFGGSRTFHRIAVAIEDAGFEIRDTLSWLYGTGFPKSLDVSAAIDKARQDDPRPVCRFLRAAMEARGVSAQQIADRFSFHSRMVDHWAARETDSQPAVPTLEQWEKLRSLLGFGQEMDGEVFRLNERKGTLGEARQAAPVLGEHESATPGFTGHRFTARDNLIRAANSDAARRWEGWGTALKPAWEPVILARKPLAGTVAANVQTHGTGALNIEGCRIGRSEWDAEASRCVSCAEAAESKQKRGIQATKGTTATNSAAPTRSEKGEARPGATSRMDTGCSVGPSPGEPAVVQSAAFNSNTEPYGSGRTDQSPTGSSSTTSTKLEQTIASQTCSSCGAPTTSGTTSPGNTGRWPSNVLLDERAAEALDAQTGTLKSGAWNGQRNTPKTKNTFGKFEGGPEALRAASEGGASRFFFVARSNECQRANSAKDADAASPQESPASASADGPAPDLTTRDSGRSSTPPSTPATGSASNRSIGSATHPIPSSGNGSSPEWPRARPTPSEPLAPNAAPTTPTATTKTTTNPSKSNGSAGGATSANMSENMSENMGPGAPDFAGQPRFMYTAKASRSERDAGCEALLARSAGEATDREDGTDGLSSPRAGAGRTGGARNIHPTVKPIALMRWLVHLVTPPGGTVLDPFTGSGSTGIATLQEGFTFIGCERESQYAEIAVHRLTHATRKP